MIILGLNAYHADSSAAIFVDGKMIAATEEERFTRVKHWAGFPKLAIEFCLREAGISIEQVDHIAIGRDPNAKKIAKLKFVLQNPFAGWEFFKNRLANQKKVLSIDEELKQLRDSSFVGMTSNSRDSSLPLGMTIHHIEHHRSHLASAFFASPFEEAALLSIDGSGDFSTAMIGIGRGNDIEVLDSIDFPHSIGIFYTAFTQLLGFPHYGDEYKVMGLAPYGEPKYTDKLEQVVQLLPNGLFKLDLSFFREAHKGFVTYSDDHIPIIPPLFGPKLEELFGKARTKEESLSQYHKDIAASVQRFTEQVIFHILNHLQKRTGLTNVCIAGGVAQNSVANGKITRNTNFKEVYIPSAGHDAGISMGSALFVQHQILKTERQPAIWSAYTGTKSSNEEIEKILTEQNVVFKNLENDELYHQVTECLINGGVVGWFNGRAEFGPRALGARSILADPRRNDAKEILNLKIKRRESFRPFAPSILKEYVKDFFEIDEPVPFMEKVFPIKKEKQSLIPAVTHADGSGRLQTVDAVTSPRYHALITKFYEKTGIPILLNTSFNENEPIVNTPQEALSCFQRTNMDMLVLENCLITR